MCVRAGVLWEINFAVSLPFSFAVNLKLRNKVHQKKEKKRKPSCIDVCKV